MNILISASGYPSPNVPYAAFVQNLAEEMSFQGNKITVIAPQSLTKSLVRNIPILPKVEVQRKDGIEICIIRPRVLSFGDGIFAWLTNLFNRVAVYVSALKVSSPDIVYAHFWSSADNILNYVVRKGLPLFVATGEDVIEFDKKISHRRLNLIKRHTSGVICVSTKNMNESIEHGLAEFEKCRVFPNAVNTRMFHLLDKAKVREMLGYSKTDFIVAYCGRFNHRKGSSRVSDAITLLRDNGVKSIFIGGLADNYKKEPDCPNILFKGRLSHDKISLYLNAADVFVLPTLAEGCPNSVVEAMACGLPIISSNLPFNYDILDETNSLLIDPMDVTGIAEAISKLKNNENLRSELMMGAITTASSLNIGTRVLRILDFINEKK